MNDYSEIDSYFQYLIESKECDGRLCALTKSVSIDGNNTTGNNLMIDIIKDSAIKIAKNALESNGYRLDDCIYDEENEQPENCIGLVCSVTKNIEDNKGFELQNIFNKLNMQYATRHIKYVFKGKYLYIEFVMMGNNTVRESTILEADEEGMKTTSNSISLLIKSILKKFVDYSAKKIADNKQYLTDMKDSIVAKVQGENIPIEMRDYVKGTANIKNFKLIPFETAKTKVKTPGEKSACEAELKTILLPAYTDLNVDFRQFCKSYFMGGDATIKTNINSLNMEDIHEYCSNFQNIENAIVEDMNSLTRLASVANQTASAIHQNNAKEKQEKNAAAQAKQQQSQNSATESAITMAIRNRNIINNIFLEVDTAPADDKKPNTYKFTMDKTANATNPTPPASTNTSTPASSTPNEKQELDNDAIMINAYRTTAIAIISGEMFAANTIYNDYINIMKTHAPENGASTAKQMTLIMDNPQDVINRIDQIQKETDKNKQTKDISDLIDSIKAKNPSFEGGLNDISSEANKLLAAQKKK